MLWRSSLPLSLSLRPVLPLFLLCLPFCGRRTSRPPPPVDSVTDSRSLLLRLLSFHAWEGFHLWRDGAWARASAAFVLWFVFLCFPHLLYVSLRLSSLARVVVLRVAGGMTPPCVGLSPPRCVLCVPDTHPCAQGARASEGPHRYAHTRSPPSCTATILLVCRSKTTERAAAQS